MRQRRSGFNSLCCNEKRAGGSREPVGSGLDAIPLILGDERAYPRMVVAVKHDAFSTTHYRAVELYEFLTTWSATHTPKFSKSEIDFIPIDSRVRHDPECQIGRQGNDSIQDAGSFRFLDGGGKVACEEWAIIS